jgi:flagellar basal body P-ring formation protein FlgA
MRWALLGVLILPSLAHGVFADALVTTRVIKAGTIIQPDDLTVVKADIPGAISDLLTVAGQEARVTIYPGRPIRSDQLGPPAVVDRNQVVSLGYIVGGLSITTEGRALARGGVGDVIRVLNLSSRNTVLGQVMPDGSVRVGPPQG